MTFRSLSTGVFHGHVICRNQMRGVQSIFTLFGLCISVSRRMKTPGKIVWQKNKSDDWRGQGSHAAEIAFEADSVLEICESQE
jgi:hypothetical protein